MAKLAVITGGSRGIGAATASRLASDGYRLIITYHTDAQAAEKVIADVRGIGCDCVAVKVDCSDSGEVMILADHPWVKEGVDALVLNHAMYQRGKASELTLEDMAKTMDVNFTGAFLVWKALSSHLSTSASVVVLGSQLGLKGTATGADYSASKGALHAWARSLAVDVAEIGQRVNVIAPGTIDTDLVAGDTPVKRSERESGIPMGRLGQPEEVASVISFLLSKDSSYITGAVLHVNGGLYRP
ncbi:MAG TPA: SDR family oxidoreductase [Candidatus Thalassarchaeaceae archaeon]|jgi:3-oxoacyl-[acyl-carrier protein] reductase|nr:SDR family oxidoreductase [Candidatus Thalassarchaeaceae archaeon]